MRKTGKNQIISQMFDIRPVDETGDLDWEKIEKVGIITDIKTGSEIIKFENVKRMKVPSRKEASVYQLGKAFKSEEIPIYQESSGELPESVEVEIEYSEQDQNIGSTEYLDNESSETEKPEPVKYAEEELIGEDWNEKIEIEKEYQEERASDFTNRTLPWNFDFRKIALSFAGATLVITLVIGGFTFLSRGLSLEDKVLGVSKEGYTDLMSAVESIKGQDFQKSSLEFNSAYNNFSQASEYLDTMGSFLVNITRFFPGVSKLSSGKNAVEAGKRISLAGESLNEVIKIIYSLENPLSAEGSQNVSLLSIFESTESEVGKAKEELEEAQENLDKIKIDDLPEDKRDEFVSLKNKLPSVIEVINKFLNNSNIFVDLLGGNGPRKYLFLFQNNQEMRATGGFIGSYGLLDISDGRIRKFFVDGIFNPDGQLKDKIVPPKPIQKISAAWSMHDSNWFPNFPTSAEKAIVFYEKTGGPTADGIITITPTIMEKLLEITGPVEMEEYGVVLDSENFIEKTQYEIEVDYDKEENRPKKILADLAPLVLNKVFNSKDIKSISKTLGVISEGLNQKHILLYSQNEDLQKIISEQGWSGEVLSTPKDYISVINTNINGYKTDGIIEESINHLAEIKQDGSIINTVTITRKHNGGNEEYEWWNKVNSNYIRVYVPKGSTLLSVEGQTIEFNDSPLDYDNLGFKRDADVQKEEEEMNINVGSGTRTYEDAGKTVFANWTYVSPQETLTLKYKYLLPFRLAFSDAEPADSYSLFAQKQSGSVGSNFVSEVKYPSNWKVRWNYPEDVEKSDGNLKMETKLDVDRFLGSVFLKNDL